MSSRKAASSAAADTKKLNIALQGGGSFGAFEWGVLDRLLADDRIEIAGLSGTSAGSINAAVTASALATGGRDKARSELKQVWREVGQDGAAFAAMVQLPALRMLGERNLDQHPAWAWLQTWSRNVSPYQSNPLNISPLRETIRRHVDSDALNGPDAPDLYIGTTDVETGQAHVFGKGELSHDVVEASTTLPELFQAVQINGRPHWDGGYVVNPPLRELAWGEGPADVLVIQVNPPEREGTPTRADEIESRKNEIVFDAALKHDSQEIQRMTNILDQLGIEGGRMQAGLSGKNARNGADSLSVRPVRMHRIAFDSPRLNLNASAKMNADPAFLRDLYREGFKAAEQWIASHLPDVGRRGTWTPGKDSELAIQSARPDLDPAVDTDVAPKARAKTGRRR